MFDCQSNVCYCTDEAIDALAGLKKSVGLFCTDPNIFGVCATAKRGANNAPTPAEKAAAEKAAAAAAAKKIADEVKATEASDKAKADLLKSNPDATPAELEAAGKKAYDASIKESNETKPSGTTASSGSILQLPATLVASAVAVLVAAIFV